MGTRDSGRVGKRGTLVIPSGLRKKFGLAEGSTVLIEDTPQGILIRPAVTLPIETYTAARTAEFLLNNAVDQEDYQAAVTEVRKLGLDPEKIDHQRPDS